jgi:hypothetical protein
MNPSENEMQTLERRLRQQAAGSMPPFDEQLHQRIMRAVASSNRTAGPSMKISRWRGPLMMLATAAAIVLGVSVVPALLKTPIISNPEAGYSVELSAGNLLRHIPKLPQTSLTLDRQMIDQQLATALSRASRVARNVMDASPIQFAIARPEEASSRQN